MYHAIVRRRIRSLFDAINRGDASPVLASFAPRFEHAFLGEHALGGARHSLALTERWYQRLYALLPDIHFTLERVAVSGPPWRTLATVEWREQNSGTDGVRTEARGVHVVELRWGRTTRLLICPDTTMLVRTLDRLAGGGNALAHATPLVD